MRKNNYKSILHDLKKCGIKAGDRIFVHSSFKSLGVDGTPDDVVNLLKDLVTEKGTLGMPTFTYSFSAEKPFNYRTSPCVVGVVPEAFRKSSGVVRNVNPSHSCSFWGKDADYCVRSSCDLSPYDMAGPFGKLYDLDFKIVMLGCGFAPNSTIHAIEHWAQLPYCKNAVQSCFSWHNGDLLEGVIYSHMPLGHRDFYARDTAKYVKLMRDNNAISSFKAGAADVHIMNARELVDICMKELDANPDLFLCDNPACSSCRSNRFDMDIWKKHGGTNWDKIWCGTAKANISPGVGTWCNQGWNSGVPAEGIIDELHARAIVFKKQFEYFVLISLDLIFVELEVADLIKERIFENNKIPPENISVTCTHTHTGPAMGSKYIWKENNRRDDSYIEHLAAKISGAVYLARKNFEPVKIGYAARKVNIGAITRRRKMPDGSVVYYKKEDYPKAGDLSEERDFCMIFFKAYSGNIKAGIGHYPCHPIFNSCIMRKISADYPGVFSTVVEEALGRDAVIMFLQGAAGDQMPQKYTSSYKEAQSAGKKLAYAFLCEALDVNCRDFTAISLISKYHKLKNSDADITTLLQLLSLEDIDIGMVPGEPFLELGKRFVTNLKNTKALLTGYASDCLGYLPDKDAFEKPTYEVTGCMNWIGGKPGIGEEIVDECGKLKTY